MNPFFLLHPSPCKACTSFPLSFLPTQIITKKQLSVLCSASYQEIVYYKWQKHLSTSLSSPSFINSSIPSQTLTSSVFTTPLKYLFCETHWKHSSYPSPILFAVPTVTCWKSGSSNKHHLKLPQIIFPQIDTFNFLSASKQSLYFTTAPKSSTLLLCNQTVISTKISPVQKWLRFLHYFDAVKP